MEDYFAPTRIEASLRLATPRIDVAESEKAYIVEAELPGVAKENIKISVDGNVVTLEAEVKRDTARKEGETVVLAERTVEKFTA